MIFLIVNRKIARSSSFRTTHASGYSKHEVHQRHATTWVAASRSGGHVRDTTRTRLSRPLGPGPVPLIYLSIYCGRPAKPEFLASRRHGKVPPPTAAQFVLWASTMRLAVVVVCLLGTSAARFAAISQFAHPRQLLSGSASVVSDQWIQSVGGSTSKILSAGSGIRGLLLPAGAHLVSSARDFSRGLIRQLTRTEVLQSHVVVFMVGLPAVRPAAVLGPSPSAHFDAPS